tara:strand:- start:2049 stop:3383 length:1335 start_codon:yes stop_codon:yes gene_type:complete
MNNIRLNTRAIIEKFFDGIFLNILLKVKGIISLPIIVNFFSKADLGMLSLWHSTSALLIGLYMLNIPDSSNRVILNLHKENKHNLIADTISSIFTFSFLMYFILTFFLSILLVFFSDNISFEFLAVLFTLIFVKILVKLGLFVFQIFQQTRSIIKAQILVEYGTLALMVMYVYLTDIRDIKHVALLFVPMAIFVSVYMINTLRKEYSLRFLIDFTIIKKILRISLFLLPSAYALIIIQNTDLLMIRYFWSLSEVGEYGFALSLASIVGALSLAISFFWYSSAVYASQRQLIKMLESINTFAPIFLITVILAYHFFSVPIISFVNHEYLNVFPTLQILIIGLFSNLNIQILSGALFALKKEKLILKSIFIGVSVNIFLNLLLVPTYGIIGGAISTSLSYIIILIAQHIFIRNILIDFANLKNGLYFFFMLFMSISYILIIALGNI